ncbi:unnamed protein product [Calypogeia fissa]
MASRDQWALTFVLLLLDSSLGMGKGGNFIIDEGLEYSTDCLQENEEIHRLNRLDLGSGKWGLEASNRPCGHGGLEASNRP